jgi:hypothetical protein
MPESNAARAGILLDAPMSPACPAHLPLPGICGFTVPPTLLARAVERRHDCRHPSSRLYGGCMVR